jgi:acyl carrier protein
MGEPGSWGRAVILPLSKWILDSRDFPKIYRVTGKLVSIFSTSLIEEHMRMENVLAKVQEVFHEAFGTDPQLISLETTPSDMPAWDSVGHLDLASRLEQAFSISFDVDDLMEMENVREIVRIIDAKLVAGV